MQRPRRRPFGFTSWPLVTGGNRVRLLRGGGEYFPRLIESIDGASQSVHLETYIFELDAIGERVIAALLAAARRGVAVRVMIDGFGADRTAAVIKARLDAAGAQVLVFRPGRWWRPERRLLRRMHRKLATVDASIAFVGGINIIDDDNHFGHIDHVNRLDAAGAALGPRYDFAVECHGPIVGQIVFAALRLWRTVAFMQRPLQAAERPRWDALRLPPSQPEDMRAALLLRDNLVHRRAIERAYIEAFRLAREDVVIAVAYFLPGGRFRRALADLAARGVRVRLLLQGRVEYWLQYQAQVALYGELLAAGVQIYEYTTSFLHAKVAVVDDRWATVGSSNIDPYSLLLAREANVVVHDRRFAQQLRDELEAAIATSSIEVNAAAYQGRGWWRRLGHRFAYMLVRLATIVATRGTDD